MTRMQQIIWAVVVVIVAIGLYWWWSSSQSASPSASGSPFSSTSTSTETNTTPSNSGTGTTGTSGTNPAPTTNSAPMSATITFNGDAFSPSNVTIAQGGTITFTSTGGPMWIASDPHPIHNGYDGTTQQQHCAAGYTGPKPFDQCSQGTSFSFTFSKVGSWGYHDHLNAGLGGTVTVVAQ